MAQRILADLSTRATVVHDDHILGVYSQTERQIDVSVRWEEAGGSHLLIVQAKDWGEPADITAIDAFASVIQDVGAHRGILVCRSGFTAQSLVYATNRGISLWNLHDATSAHWNLQLTVPIVWHQLRPALTAHVQARFEGGDQILQYKLQPFALSEDPGRTVLNPYTAFVRAWNEGRLRIEPNTLHHVHGTSDRQIFIGVMDQHGNRAWREVDHFGLVYTVEEVGVWLGNFTPDECRGFVDFTADDAFFVTHLPLGQIPIRPGSDWQPIDDPALIATRVRGTLISADAYIRLDAGAMSLGDVSMHRITE